jgi:hypothetical protein
MDVVMLGGAGVDHHKIVQSRFADQVASAVNEALEASSSGQGAAIANSEN